MDRTWHGTDPVTPADHVRVGSNTRTRTGTVILPRVDEGKVSLLARKISMIFESPDLPPEPDNHRRVQAVIQFLNR